MPHVRPMRAGLFHLLLTLCCYLLLCTCHDPQLFGFVWKGQMRLLYPSTAAYATVMADVASFTGACTIGLMLVSKFFFQVSDGRWRTSQKCTCHNSP